MVKSKFFSYKIIGVLFKFQRFLLHFLKQLQLIFFFCFSLVHLKRIMPLRRRKFYVVIVELYMRSYQLQHIKN